MTRPGLSVLALLLLNFGAPALGHLSPATDGARPVYLIGLLSEQAVPVCTGSQDYSWADAHLSVGFVRLSPTQLETAPLLGRPVLVRGRHDAVYRPEAPRHTGECPLPAQMRSDWLVSRDGIRIERPVPAPVRAVSPFAATSIVPFDGLSLQRRGPQLQVRLHNPLDRGLEGLELRAHYEGCFGKPANHLIRRSFAELAPGDLVQASFDGNLHLPEDPLGRHHYALNSIQIVTSNQDVLFDFDRPLHEPELRFSCKNN